MKTLFFKHLLIAAFLVFFGQLFAEDIYDEKDAILVVEVESQPLNQYWSEGTASIGAIPITYYYNSRADYFSAPGNGILNYKVQINNPGTYRFQWHSKVGVGLKATDYNDSWLKVLGADDFYGKKSLDGHIVRPRPTCSGDECPEGTSKDGWFKVYSTGANNTTQNWKWHSYTNDNDKHAIYMKFDNAGVYTIQISARSTSHFLNRFVLYKESQYSESAATSLSLPPSGLVGDDPSALENAMAFDVKVFPNPAHSHLIVSSTNSDLTCYEVLSVSGKSLMKDAFDSLNLTVDISSLASGLYILNIFDKTGRKSTTKFSKEL